jgi:hypothetical protein
MAPMVEAGSVLKGASSARKLWSGSNPVYLVCATVIFAIFQQLGRRPRRVNASKMWNTLRATDGHVLCHKTAGRPSSPAAFSGFRIPYCLVHFVQCYGSAVSEQSRRARATRSPVPECWTIGSVSLLPVLFSTPPSHSC